MLIKELKVFATIICMVALTFSGCSSDDETPKIDLLSIEVDGTSLSVDVENVPVDAEITMLFGAAVSQQGLSDQLTLTSGGSEVSFAMTLTNASTKVVLTPDLDFAQEYVLNINNGPIGANGERLEQLLEARFTTAGSGIITEANPCTSVGSCLQTVSFDTPDGVATLDYYSNYPIYETNASWENLTSAIIVVHGANRNADDYFSYLTKTLNDESLSESTILIAPFFKDDSEADAGELHWSSNAWREGQNSGGTVKLSAFSVIDSLVAQLSNTSLFPVLENVIVTGHSSGGLFTHVYAVANQVDNDENSLKLDYVVANSQYFYYPNNFRFDEDTEAYFEPDGCTLFNSWPMGPNNLPNYLSGMTSEGINEQFFERNVTYLLGNGSGADPALNTEDCEATLLGSTRFSRGENSYRHTMDYFSSVSAHQKIIVEGIGHDGQGMYQSEAFKNLLHNLVD